MPIDILLDPAHNLSDATRQAILSEQLQEADCIMAALDCSTKSRAREIPLHFSDGRPGPKRSSEHPEGLPGLNPRDAAMVERDNKAAEFVLEEIQAMVQRGRRYDQGEPCSEPPLGVTQGGRADGLGALLGDRVFCLCVPISPVPVSEATAQRFRDLPVAQSTMRSHSCQPWMEAMDRARSAGLSFEGGGRVLCGIGFCYCSLAFLVGGASWQSRTTGA